MAMTPPGCVHLSLSADSDGGGVEVGSSGQQWDDRCQHHAELFLVGGPVKDLTD